MRDLTSPQCGEEQPGRRVLTWQRWARRWTAWNNSAHEHRSPPIDVACLRIAIASTERYKCI